MSRAATAITRLRIAAGTLLCATGLGIGILMGYSWDNTGGYVDHTDDDKADNVMIVALVCVPIVMLLLWRKVGGTIKAKKGSARRSSRDFEGVTGVVPTAAEAQCAAELTVQTPKPAAQA